DSLSHRNSTVLVHSRLVQFYLYLLRCHFQIDGQVPFYPVDHFPESFYRHTRLLPERPPHRLLLNLHREFGLLPHCILYQSPNGHTAISSTALLLLFHRSQFLVPAGHPKVIGRHFLQPTSHTSRRSPFWVY